MKQANDQIRRHLLLLIRGRETKGRISPQDADVRFGSLADIKMVFGDVRFNRFVNALVDTVLFAIVFGLLVHFLFAHGVLGCCGSRCPLIFEGGWVNQRPKGAVKSGTLNLPT
jgi:hypothetical protein